MCRRLILRTVLLPLVPLSELLDGSLDVLHAALLPHCLSGEVAVGPRSVPVSSNGLGVKRDHDTKVLRYTLEDIPEDQKML